MCPQLLAYISETKTAKEVLLSWDFPNGLETTSYLWLLFLHSVGKCLALSPQSREAAQVHGACAARERQLQCLRGSIEQQTKQLTRKKEPTSQTVALKTLLELEVPWQFIQQVFHLHYFSSCWPLVWDRFVFLPGCRKQSEWGRCSLAGVESHKRAYWKGRGSPLGFILLRPDRRGVSCLSGSL